MPDPPVADGLQRETYLEVRYKAAMLADIGHNQLGHLSQPIDRFLAAAPERIEEVSITRLWSRGNTLRRQLKAHEMVATSADPTDPARLTPRAAALLGDLVEVFNVFIVRDPKGRELDDVRLGPKDRAKARRLLMLQHRW